MCVSVISLLNEKNSHVWSKRTFTELMRNELVERMRSPLQKNSKPNSQTQIISRNRIVSLPHYRNISPLLPSFLYTVCRWFGAFFFLLLLFRLFLVVSCALPSFLLARHIVSDCTNLIVYRSKVNEDVRSMASYSVRCMCVYSCCIARESLSLTWTISPLRVLIGQVALWCVSKRYFIYYDTIRWEWSHTRSATLWETHGAVIVVMRSQRMCNLVEISADSHH